MQKFHKIILNTISVYVFCVPTLGNAAVKARTTPSSGSSLSSSSSGSVRTLHQRAMDLKRQAIDEKRKKAELDARLVEICESVKKDGLSRLTSSENVSSGESIE